MQSSRGPARKVWAPCTTLVCAVGGDAILVNAVHSLQPVACGARSSLTLQYRSPILLLKGHVRRHGGVQNLAQWPRRPHHGGGGVPGAAPRQQRQSPPRRRHHLPRPTHVRPGGSALGSGAPLLSPLAAVTPRHGAPAPFASQRFSCHEVSALRRWPQTPAVLRFCSSVYTFGP